MHLKSIVGRNPPPQERSASLAQKMLKGGSAAGQKIQTRFKLVAILEYLRAAALDFFVQ